MKKTKFSTAQIGVYNTGNFRVDGDLFIHQYLGSPPPLKPLTALHQLPSGSSNFLGRQAEREGVLKALRAGWGVCITGMPGCGKTAFAIDLANSLRSEYPDGQLYIELQSSRHSEIDVTDQLSRCLELMVGFKQQTPMSLDDLRKLFRSSLNGTKSLVVVDDAATAAQIEPFMPPSGCALITTTRHLLNVGNCININLAGLEMQDAVTLLFYAAGRLLGEQSSQRIAELCGLLPLALNAAGGFLKITPDMSPDAYAELLLTARKKGT